MGLQQNSSIKLKYQAILAELGPHQKILAVSKFQETEKIKELASFGQKHFAENYIQEATEKIEQTKDLNLTWHFIGSLQKNKVKLLKKNFAYIHSVNSFELAKLISEKAAQINYVQKIFIQLNLSGEKSKSGFEAESFQKQWPQLKALRGVLIVGLMTMPPLENVPEKNRVFFKTLKKIGNSLSLNEFSMGTSHDYKIALEEGATWIRLGTVLFGDRIKK